MIKPWKTIRSTPVGDFRIFNLRSDAKISPRTGKEHDFYVLDASTGSTSSPSRPTSSW